MTAPSLRRRLDLLITLLVGVACFAIYVKTLAPTLLMADGAEFQFACYLLGIAHPTGYPLYLILGWLWSHLLPFGDAAYRVNLLSALFASLAVGLMYPLSLHLLKRSVRAVPLAALRAIAVIATLSLALSRTFWSQAVRAEVYALNSLFVVATLFLLLLWSGQEPKPSTIVCLAALVYGLSLTHHSTMILFLPAYVLFICLTHRSALTDLKSLSRLLILLLAPLLLYLYIPWRASATPYLYVYLGPGRELELYENTLRGFLSFVTGAMFRGELVYQAPLLERLTMTWGLLLQQFSIAGVLLGILGIIRLGMSHWKILLLLGLSYLCVVTFNLFYLIGDIRVLYTPSYIIFAIWMALGMSSVIEAAARLRNRWERAYAVLPCALILLFAVLPLSAVWNNYRTVDRSDDYRAREMWEEILAQPVPEGAILVSNDRNEITPLLYLQHVEGMRPDLVGLFPLIVPEDGYANVVRVIDSVIDVERPLYLVKEMPGLEIKYEMQRSGPLVQVLSPAITGEPRSPTELPLNHILLLVGYDVEPASPSAGEEMHVALHWRVTGELTEDYHSYVHLADAAGNIIAQSDHRPGGDYYPTTLWQPGEVLLDPHDLAIPVDIPAGTYRLLGGMYLYPSLEPLGKALTIGAVPVSR